MQNQSNVYQQLFEKLLHTYNGSDEAALIALIKTDKVVIDTAMCVHTAAHAGLVDLFKCMVRVVDPSMMPLIFTKVVENSRIEKLEILFQMGHVPDREKLLEIVNMKSNPNPRLIMAILKKRD